MSECLHCPVHLIISRGHQIQWNTKDRGNLHLSVMAAKTHACAFCRESARVCKSSKHCGQIKAQIAKSSKITQNVQLVLMNNNDCIKISLHGCRKAVGFISGCPTEDSKKLGPLCRRAKVSATIDEFSLKIRPAAQLPLYEFVEEILSFHLICKGSVAKFLFFSHKNLKVVIFSELWKNVRISGFQAPLSTI